MTYAADEIYREAAYIAYWYHWALDDILDMEHGLRRRFGFLAREIIQAEG